MALDLNRKLVHAQFLRRESFTQHHHYEDELQYLSYIKDGDVEGLKKYGSSPARGDTGMLSEDPVRNAQYLFVCNITVITRIAIERGMEEEEAYSTSDLYIQHADKCASVDAVMALKNEMIEYFTKKINGLKKQNVFSKPIVQCLDYIYDHLHQPLRAADLAEAVGLTPAYFSTLFKQEMGVPVSEFIRRKRVEAAENMLRYSEFSLTEISQYLAFSSYSHFADVFRVYTKITPKEYRRKFYKKTGA